MRFRHPGQFWFKFWYKNPIKQIKTWSNMQNIVLKKFHKIRKQANLKYWPIKFSSQYLIHQLSYNLYNSIWVNSQYNFCVKSHQIYSNIVDSQQSITVYLMVVFFGGNNLWSWVLMFLTFFLVFRINFQVQMIFFGFGELFVYLSSS